MKHLIKRLLFYVLLIAGVLLIGGGISVYLYKDRLIQQFIREANQYINTPVHVEKIDISAFEHFPYVSISLNGVVVEESYTWSTDTLLCAEQVTFAINPIDVLKGEYEVNQMYLVNATATLKVDRKGVVNYSIIDKKGKSTSANFDLNKITGINVTFSYEDLKSGVNMRLFSSNMKSTIRIKNDVYAVEANGDILSKHIEIGGRLFLENKELQVNTSLAYERNIKKITIEPSLVKTYQSDFVTEGYYALGDSEIYLSLRNDKTNLRTILDLIPNRYTIGLEKYNSTGAGHFDLLLDGKFYGGAYPAININFGLKEASIFHPDLQQSIDSVTLAGRYESSDMMDLSKTKLTLSEVSGKLGDEVFEAGLEYTNFQNPFVEFNFNGNVGVGLVADLLPKKQLVEASGHIMVDVNLKGHINDLKKKSTMSKVKTTGQLDFHEVGFLHTDSGMPFSALKGAMLFNNNDLALTNFSGKVGASDFVLNGIIKNFATYVLVENQPIGIEADLVSSLVDMDELLSGNYTKSKNAEEYSFSISPNLQLRFNCKIDQLKFRNFLGNNISGDLMVKNQVAASENIALEAMNGSLSLSGSADASTDSIFVFSEAKLNHIALDQLFFVFENFKQDFLTDKHLKGNVDAEINAFLAFDKNLNFNDKELIADISANIEGGELNDFSPLMALSSYIDEKDLNALRFSELKNDIHIEDQTIYLPVMQVNNNASNITIGGTHTFDQHINYDVIAPLNNKKKIDRDAAFGAIEEDDSGKAKVFLKITGTTDDFEVNYDARALKKEVVKGLKKEVKELKDAFRTKGKKEKKEVVLEDDEYFDW